MDLSTTGGHICGKTGEKDPRFLEYDKFMTKWKEAKSVCKIWTKHTENVKKLRLHPSAEVCRHSFFYLI